MLGERHDRVDTNDNQQNWSIPSPGSYKKLTLGAQVQRMVEQAFDDAVDCVIKDVIDGFRGRPLKEWWRTPCSECSITVLALHPIPDLPI